MATAYIVFKAILAILLWGGAAIGYWIKPLAWWERVWALVAAGFLIAALPATDEIGLGLTALLMVWHALRVRQDKRALQATA